ncbi:MAG: hypothetical protein Fur0046_13500 [Cyanobacteria bacterium J069]|nr:MAG: collagen-like protein [Cyanobacteria bacterium J069]
MPRRLLSLCLSTATLSSSFALAEAVLCPQPALAQITYGQNGQTGLSGRDGRSGRDGETRFINADGTPQRLELAGEAGTDGEDGDSGRNAFCGTQQRTASNQQAASGGDGGSGGNGGNGGNGGALTIYYTDLTHLRQIYVMAAGGVGGRSGRGGIGGYGCQCSVRSWEMERCTGSLGSQTCSGTTRYHCTDGRNGSRGRDGRDGQPGRAGMLSLVNQPEPLLPETPTATVPLAQLLNQATPLSRNLWTPKRGAAQLLAGGSIVADEYREYAGRAEGSVQIDWQAARPVREFANAPVTVEIGGDRQIRLSFPEDLWVDGSLSQSEGTTVFAARYALRRDEATQLRLGELSGSGSSLQLVVLDLADQSDEVATEFQIRIRTAPTTDRGRPPFRTRFEGTVPPALVTRDRSRFVLALGQLPLSSSDLAPGLRYEIDLTAVRSFARRSATQTLDKRGDIRR